MPSEQEFQIHPIVQESVVHNTKASFQLLTPPSPRLNHRSNKHVLAQTLSNLHSLTASLFGISAGVLGLESYSGFLVYFVFSCVTTLLFYGLKVAPESLSQGHAPFDPSRFYRGAFDFWLSGAFSGISGFILTWTLFYGLVRA